MTLPTKLALSIASGLLLVSLFPPFGYAWLAPVALSPILIACAREPRWTRRVWLGWTAGFVFWAGMCPWIEFVMEVHGAMGRWGGWATFLLFGLYKGLPMAAFSALAGFAMGVSPGNPRGRWWSIPAVAALWTGIERLHSFTGFAWLDLGNAGIGMPLPMRLAPITGVYGLTFVFALLAAAVASLAPRSGPSEGVLARPRRELAWLVPLVLLVALPGLPRPSAPHERALVVQPNFDADMPWTADSLAFTEQKLALLSKAGRASLLIWPEAPAPFYPSDPSFRAYIAHVAEDAQAPFLLGGVGYNERREPLNSAFLLDAGGAIEGQYDKVNLVPFGEFIPPMFGWVNRITHEIGDFVPGDRVVVFRVDGHGAGAFICYESVLPDFVRQFVHGGAEVLVNLSNDGYFGHSAAHDQHLLIARMRAAENRRWLLRSTNDGITAVIDPRGRIAARLPPYTQTSGLMPFDYVTSETPYTRYGDWFAWGCLVAGLLLAGLGISRAGSPAHHRP